MRLPPLRRLARWPARTRSRIRLLLVVTALPAAVLAMTIGSTAPAQTRQHTTWFVSRHGDDTVGTSWATAWTQPSDIDWTMVSPGDRIVFDGGGTRCRSDYPLGVTTTAPPGVHCGMVYTSPFIVRDSGVSGAPITIALSRSPGHDGTAVFAGGRVTPLPYCDQRSYRAAGKARDAGITIPGRSHVVIDGSHRSGMMIYGARSGVDLRSDRTSHIVLRNLEILDDGTYERWAHGYRTDGEGISLAGRHITIDRDLIHDNGQDAIQDRDTGVRRIGHAPMRDISITNSWLYEHRENPLFRGYGFNSGSQEIPRQDCTHVDGLQVWGGGLHQQGMTFADDVFGPFLAQGVYPGDDDTTSFDHVTVTNSLFLNVLDHSIIGPSISSDPSTPSDWRIRSVTSFMTRQPAPALSTHGSVDLAGSGSSVTRSLFDHGYFAAKRLRTARGNVWWGGERVPGGVRRNPHFVGLLPNSRSPSFDTLIRLDLAPRCGACRRAGSSLHDVGDLLRRIDRLDGSAHSSAGPS